MLSPIRHKAVSPLIRIFFNPFRSRHGHPFHYCDKERSPGSYLSFKDWHIRCPLVTPCFLPAIPVFQSFLVFRASIPPPCQGPRHFPTPPTAHPSFDLLGWLFPLDLDFPLSKVPEALSHAVVVQALFSPPRCFLQKLSSLSP